MQRINFAVEDMARVCVAKTMNPMTEALFALELMERVGHGSFASWRKRVFAQIEPYQGLLGSMARLLHPIPDLLWILSRPTLLDHQQLRLLGLDQREVAKALYLFCQAAVAPYWWELHAYLEAERELRSRIMADSGTDQLLRTLHPGMRWSAPVLEIPGNHAADVELAGRGLTLLPSVFQCSRVAVIIHEGSFAANPTLVFSAAPNGSGASDLLREQDASRSPVLEPLLGRTRTAVLRALCEARTTTELAQWLSISTAGASQHATVLRGAGLVSTRRSKNAVFHKVTPLGVALIEGTLPPVATGSERVAR